MIDEKYDIELMTTQIEPLTKDQKDWLLEQAKNLEEYMKYSLEDLESLDQYTLTLAVKDAMYAYVYNSFGI